MGHRFKFSLLSGETGLFPSCISTSIYKEGCPMIFRWIFPWFSHGLLGISLRSRCYTPVIHHSHLCEDTLGQLPFVNGLAFLKNFHMPNFCFFFWGGEVGPSQKTLKAFFFWCEKKNKQLHQCTSMKSRITSEIPWLNVFSSACLEVYATLSTCAACS